MKLLRLVGYMCLLIAAVVATIDAIKNLAAPDGDWIFTSLGDQLQRLSPKSLVTAEAAVDKYAGHFWWDPITTEVLRAPTWEGFGALGFLLVWLGRKRAPGQVEF
jgi:hypothetical protein